jgi:hypothetical protein
VKVSGPCLRIIGPAPGIVADIVFGTIWYRTLATRQPLDADLVDDLIGLLAPTS